MRRSSFVDNSATLLQIFNPRSAPIDQKYGWTWDQAIARVRGFSWSVTDWREVAVYLALQYLRAEAQSGQEARLALLRIADILRSVEDADRRGQEKVAQAMNTGPAEDLFGGAA